MRKMKKTLVMILALALATGAITSCGNKKNNANGFDISNATGITENTMPVSKEGIEISMYIENRSRGALETYADSEMMKEFQKITGVKINFDHPVGSYEDQLNLMLSSGELPDVMYLPTYFYGGWKNLQTKKAAYGGTFLKLDEYIDKFAPNLKTFLEKNPEINAEYHMANADGSVYSIPSMPDDLSYNYFDGYFIRKDWLDKLGLEVPQTIEEWENVLRAFKEQDPNGNGEKDEVGFSTFGYMTKFVFMPAFDVYNCNYYLNPETKKITHGVLEDGMKDYLKTMNRWYNEGLLNPEYVSTDQKTLDYLVLNDKVGAFYCDNNNSAMKFVSGNPDMELIAVPFIKSPDGQRRSAKIDKNYIGTHAALISSQTKYPVEIVRMFDYLFSDEGIALHNWGIEGDSYTVDESGNKHFTDIILKNPDGKNVVDAYNAYNATGINGGFPGVYDTKVHKELNSIFTDKQRVLQSESVKYCAEVDKTAALPWSPTTIEEDEEINTYAADLNTYISEMYDKFIVGTESIDNYDAFKENVKKMGLERIIEIKQTAYERGLKNTESIIK